MEELSVEEFSNLSRVEQDNYLAALLGEDEYFSDDVSSSDEDEEWLPKTEADAINVKDLVVAYKGSGRNITTDNFFTALPLAKNILSWKLTVSTMRKNKKYIPKEMAPTKTREEYSSLFGYHENITPCSYVPKKDKAVILLSSMPASNAVSGPKQKPDIIHYYNKTKSGVDVMDQMLGRYTTKRRTKRWALAFFYNILDLAALSSYIIYVSNSSMQPKRSNDRRTFLRQLGEELFIPTKRAKNLEIIRHFGTKLAIGSILTSLDTGNIPHSSTPSTQSSQRLQPSFSLDATGRRKIVGSCHMCQADTARKRRKTRKDCRKCFKPVCDEHANTITLCKSCPIESSLLTYELKALHITRQSLVKP